MAADVTISDTKLYRVDPPKNVEITVHVGEGQAGGTSILFNGTERPAAHDIWIAVGAPGEDLTFKTLHCVTTVRDINPSTNRTSVSYSLRGGPIEQTFPFRVDVSENGHARYVIDFVFVS